MAPCAYILAVTDSEKSAAYYRDVLGFRPYGMREIIVTTPDGHRIVFGQQVR